LDRRVQVPEQTPPIVARRSRRLSAEPVRPLSVSDGKSFPGVGRDGVVVEVRAPDGRAEAWLPQFPGRLPRTSERLIEDLVMARPKELVPWVQPILPAGGTYGQLVVKGTLHA